MNKYLFLLGNHPQISSQEIESVFDYLKISTIYKSVTREIILVNTEIPIDAKEIIKKLGGSIKIARVFDECTSINTKKIFNILDPQSKKIRFAFSSYTEKINKRNINNYLKEIKYTAREKNIRVNYIIPKENNALSSAQVFHKIMPNGYEIIIAEHEGKYILAKTEAVQDVNVFSKLDYGIPYSQKKAGMLPPKLAQMMINLSLSKDKNMCIYDPFCGTGRIIIEAIYMGFNDVYGSDIEKDAIEKTKGNVKWFSDEFRKNIDEKFYEKNIFVHDAKNPLDNLINKFNSIVTEPDLGKPYKTMPSQQEIEENFTRLEDIYIESFGVLKNNLQDGAKVIIVFPMIDKSSLLDRVVDNLKSLGYYMERNFIYARDYQIVKRHIGVFSFSSSNKK